MRMRQNRGVCSKLCPFKLLAEFGKVLDDSVVYDGNFVVARGVRVGVALAWSAMRCPAGMSDATRACVIEVLHRLS